MTKSKFALHAFSLALLAIVVATPAAAGTATTTFTVTAQVLPSCLVAATPLNFGIYSSASSSVATNTITATCTPTTGYTVALDAGTGAGATVASRSMTGLVGAEALNYGLYTNVGHTTIWGDGTSGTSTVSGTGTGLPQAITDYGLIPSGQSVDPDTYNDLITVTLSY